MGVKDFSIQDSSEGLQMGEEGNSNTSALTPSFQQLSALIPWPHPFLVLTLSLKLTLLLAAGLPQLSYSTLELGPLEHMAVC